MRSIPGSSALLFAAFSGALAALSGCKAGDLAAPLPAAHADDPAPRRGGILRLSSFADIRVIDPANVADGLVPEVNNVLFAGLVDYDEAGRVVPDLAERWEVLDDGKRFRFVLRRGARFHDGEEVTADDVKRSVERALGPGAPNPYASFYESLVGFAAFQSGKEDALRGVTVEGRYVVDFRLSERDATFLPVLALQPLRPVCRSAGRRYSDAWTPCGAGPFRFVEGGTEHGRHVSVVRHEGYHKPGLPHLDGITWTFLVNLATERFKFERGDIDVLHDFLQADVTRLVRDPRWRPFGAFDVERQIGGESMNTEIPPFDNVEIRRAVAAAIDREHYRLVRPANIRPFGSPVPPAVPGYDPAAPVQRFDPAAALEHMRKAGYPYDPATRTGGWPHPIPYYVYRTGLAEYTAQILVQELARIGLRLEIHVVNYPTYIAFTGRRGKAPITSYGWQQDYPHPHDFFDPLFHSHSIAEESSNNTAFYRNPDLDDLLDRAKRELDPAAQKVLYAEAQRIVCDEAPWAFTHTFRFYDVHQPYVRGYRPHAVWTHRVQESWLDRTGADGPRALLDHGRREALGALLGSARDARGRR